MRFLAVMAVCCASAPCFAGELAATFEPNGSIVLKDGERALAHLTPKTPKDQRGALSLREVMASGRHLVQVRLPVLGDPSGRAEAWIGERTASAVSPIWSGEVGPRDADGENTLEVDISPSGVEQYRTARRLSSCDGQPVRLFRKRWDFGSHTFVAAAPELPARAAVAVEARRGNALPGRSSSGFFFSAASSSPGADDPSRLKPPAAVNDDNPETVWTGAGTAAGQTLTARSSAGFPIVGVRLLPGDARSESSYRASAKPRRLVLVFGKAPGQSVEVELVEDADGGSKRYREPYWIALPRPVSSTCVSVIVREATSDRAPLAISDMAVMTELDGPNAADRLVEDLANARNCVARTPLLTRMGAPAVAKVAAAITKAAPGQGRECLVQALAELLAHGEKPGPEVAAALVAAIERSSEQEEKIVFALLPTLQEAPVPALASVLADAKRSDEDRSRAGRVLARMQSPEAAAALIAGVGRGSASLRKSLRLDGSTCKATQPAAALAALSATPASETARRADLLWVAAALAERQPAAQPEVRAALERALHSPASFEEKARALQGLGMLKDAAALALLTEIRAQSQDGVLRSLAATELAASDKAEALPALRDALADADPRVREIAAEAVGRKGDKSAGKTLVEGAKQEPWPSVRRAEIAALGELCVPEGNALLVRAFQRDREEVRQAALVGIARCYGPKATGPLLRTLGRLPESADMRSLAARLLAERKDPRVVPALTEALKRLLRESEGDLSLEGVVADTAVALAEIRTPEAISALISLLSDRRASIERIAIDVLGMICDPGAGAAALHAASAAKDDAVATPAAAAERNCRDRRRP